MRLNKLAQAEMLEHKLEKLFADQRLFRWVLVKREKWTGALLEATKRSRK